MLFHNEYSSVGNQRLSSRLRSLINLHGFANPKIYGEGLTKYRPEWSYYEKYATNNTCYFPFLIDPNFPLIKIEEAQNDLGPKLAKNTFPPDGRKNADNKILCIGCSFTAGDPFSSWRDVCCEIAKELNDDVYLEYADVIKSSVSCAPDKYTDPLQTYPSFLGNMLRNHDVWNCGLCGAGSYLHYFYRLEDYVVLKPKTVIFQIMEPCRNPSFFLPETVFKNYCGSTFDWNSNGGGGEFKDYYFKMHNEMWDSPKFIIKNIINKDWFFIKKIYDTLQCKFVFLINNERYPIGWYKRAKYKSPINEVVNRFKKFENSILVVTHFNQETEDASSHPGPMRHKMTAEVLEIALNAEIYDGMEIHNSEGYSTTFYTT